MLTLHEAHWRADWTFEILVAYGDLRVDMRPSAKTDFVTLLTLGRRITENDEPFRFKFLDLLEAEFSKTFVSNDSKRRQGLGWLVDSIFNGGGTTQLRLITLTHEDQSELKLKLYHRGTLCDHVHRPLGTSSAAGSGQRNYDFGVNKNLSVLIPTDGYVAL